jgi:hypothetical protein
MGGMKCGVCGFAFYTHLTVMPTASSMRSNPGFHVKRFLLYDVAFNRADWLLFSAPRTQIHWKTEQFSTTVLDRNRCHCTIWSWPFTGIRRLTIMKICILALISPRSSLSDVLQECNSMFPRDIRTAIMILSAPMSVLELAWKVYLDME